MKIDPAIKFFVGPAVDFQSPVQITGIVPDLFFLCVCQITVFFSVYKHLVW